jgi:glutamyl-tRNA reductase
MNLLLLGVNHKTASVELREKLAGLIPDLPAAYQGLKDAPEFSELILYSTCNRVELLCVAPEAEPALARLRAFLNGAPEVSPELLAESLYVHRDAEAVRHLFRVAASLDSMVLGEPQILGQVKEAYRQAT